MLSFLDAYQGYNQISLAPEDQEKMRLVTDQRVFCYNVMPFGLKNIGTTYQRLVNHMFQNQIGRNMEVYIDDMLVKSAKEQDHIEDLEECFQILTTFGMKLNPAKCTFGVRGGKLLGYMISKRGIEVNLEKINAIMDMSPLKSIREVQKLVGRLAVLNRFISRSADKSLHFFKILCGVAKFEWTKTSQETFNELTKYLASPHLLTKPETGETFYLYLAVFENAISSVLVRQENREHQSVYYASKVLGELALAARAKRIVIYSDSKLVVNQVQGSYEARDEKMAKYFLKAKNMLEKFEGASVVQVSRTTNATADQLAKLASSMAVIRSRKITFISSKKTTIKESEEIICIDPTLLSWKEEIIRFLTNGVQLESKKDAKVLRRKASRFVMIDGEL
ncbi:UNVERIFIED_CONTAM: Retrovirus-related Pol polyprotein from transposon opus [Sesamum calycinum]|uniref:Retrovirus-related Pol polyprotein from transposon opus n=1 Tax=Sesamum calycinum TaxID=2727403 RepID=A0AAW2MDJ1_9LAMI